ncbi:MAG: class II aldolase/adducin family protein [Clostridiales Family XIII bacterium]|jgi:L-fuculose-phosphate aldolase|nr:class II aldolase/adducin family protein [Clostridiales Family XIII bacterium]
MLEDLKLRIIRSAVAAEQSGLCRQRSGNFSMIDRERGLIVISPSALDRNTIEIDDIPVISMNGDIVEKGKRARASTEYPMHIKAYETRADISSVIHTHSEYATVFAVKGKPIKPVVFEAFFYGVRTAVAKYGRPGTARLAESVVDPLRDADVCLLKNHGVLVVGGAIEETLLKAQYVEDVAKLYYLSICLGNGAPDVIPAEEFELYKEETARNNIPSNSRAAEQTAGYACPDGY